MLEIAKAIWDVASGIFGARTEIAKARRDRRDRLANYFSELAGLIESVAASLRLNQYPHGSCAQLQGLGQLMEKTLKGLVPPEDAQRYQAELLRVWEIEQLFGQLQNMPEKDRSIRLNQLAEAAGYFRATAAHLRVV